VAASTPARYALPTRVFVDRRLDEYHAFKGSLTHRLRMASIKTSSFPKVRFDSPFARHYHDLPDTPLPCPISSKALQS
jgi:hypothetical protein